MSKVLLIDDDKAEHLWVSQQLKENAPAFDLTCRDSLQKGLEHLSWVGADVVILDLHLPDSHGIETFHRLQAHSKRVPVVVLSGLNDEESGMEAIRRGAQDYLVKGDVNGKSLTRVIQYAMHRHDRSTESRDPQLIDDMTGLYNQRGFLVMAERHLKMAQRANRGFFINCVYINNLPDIHAVHGEAESRLATVTVTKILEESFRTPDLIAHVGAGRFAVIVPDENPCSFSMFKRRLQKSQTYYASQFNHYKLSLSVCATPIDPSSIKTVQDISQKIDKVFSHHKPV